MFPKCVWELRLHEWVLKLLEWVWRLWGGWCSFIWCYCYLRHDRQMKSIILGFNRSFNFSVELWEIIFKTHMLGKRIALWIY